MSPPTPAFLAEVLDDQGLSMSQARIEEAAAAHGRIRAGLEELRSLQLSFLEPVIEPATALRWLESGGASR